jgi:hypothetical protein
MEFDLNSKYSRHTNFLTINSNFWKLAIYLIQLLPHYLILTELINISFELLRHENTERLQKCNYLNDLISRQLIYKTWTMSSFPSPDGNSPPQGLGHGTPWYILPWPSDTRSGTSALIDPLGGGGASLARGSGCSLRLC